MSARDTNYQSLRQMYRMSEYRRFRARHRSNRYAQIIGFGPTGKVIAWFEGNDEIVFLEPDEADWTERTTYV